jgi:hypothetical protein
MSTSRSRRALRFVPVIIAGLLGLFALIYTIGNFTKGRVGRGFVGLMFLIVDLGLVMALLSFSRRDCTV